MLAIAAGLGLASPAIASAAEIDNEAVNISTRANLVEPIEVNEISLTDQVEATTNRVGEMSGTSAAELMDVATAGDLTAEVIDARHIANDALLEPAHFLGASGDASDETLLILVDALGAPAGETGTANFRTVAGHDWGGTTT